MQLIPTKFATCEIFATTDGQVSCSPFPRVLRREEGSHGHKCGQTLGGSGTAWKFCRGAGASSGMISPRPPQPSRLSGVTVASASISSKGKKSNEVFPQVLGD